MTGHGVPAGLLDELADASTEFFALPAADKLEIAMERGGRFCSLGLCRPDGGFGWFAPFASSRTRPGARLGQPGTYAATMARLGYSEREITEVSDRLVDGIVGYGDAAAIAAKVREHLAAGADHVMVMPAGTDFADGVDQLEQLAPTLAGLAS